MDGLEWYGRRPTLPGVTPVPSARQGLTSLFGMGRGGAPALGRPMSFGTIYHVPNIKSYVPGPMSRPHIELSRKDCNGTLLFQVFGQLVPLGYAVAGFTPAAYQRCRL